MSRAGARLCRLAEPGKMELAVSSWLRADAPVVLQATSPGPCTWPSKGMYRCTFSGRAAVTALYESLCSGARVVSPLAYLWPLGCRASQGGELADGVGRAHGPPSNSPPGPHIWTVRRVLACRAVPTHCTPASPITPVRPHTPLRRSPSPEFGEVPPLLPLPANCRGDNKSTRVVCSS